MSTKPYVIVAGTDYSGHAVRALGVAYEQALHHLPAELHVVHVCMAAAPTPTVRTVALSGLASLPMRSLDEHRQALSEHLDRELAKLPGFAPAQVRVIGHIVVDSPAIGLARLASELEADLIVVGSHGGNGLARWLLGSVAGSITRLARSPVLVVPPEPHELAVPVIEPPCPHCVAARRASSGAELWCEQHRERHGRRHTYHQSDRAAAETNMPLVVR